MQSFYVYVISGGSRKLEVGVTTDLLGMRSTGRVEEPGHRVSRQSSRKLLYFECFQQEEKARNRQRDIDAWKLDKLLELIEFVNPEWYDLASDSEDLQNTLDQHDKKLSGYENKKLK